MKFIKIPFLFLWRFWFYFMIFVTIILMAPLLFILTIKEELYPQFWKLIRIWAKVLIYGMGFRLKFQFDQHIDSTKSYMFCPNHGSLLDPFVLIATSKNPIVFVGKKELVVLPVFGFFYKRVCIMVDREDPNSRKAVYGHAQRKLKQGLSLCIFAEGLVTSPEIKLAPFKNGVFRFSIHCQIPIVPMSFYDCERRYPYHFSYNHFVGGPGLLRAKVHKHIDTKGLEEKDMENLKQKVYDFMLNDLAPRL